MNSCKDFLSADNLRKLALTMFCLAALFSALPASADAPPAEPKRFLFIIDASANMKPLEKAVSETLFDLVYSGMRGHMTNGDTYGIWMVNDQNDTSFKMEVWKHKYAVEIAAHAAKHVKDRGFRGKPGLGQAMADAAVVIKNVEDLKVILISNGETPITGTPFDDIVNLRFREMAPHMKKAKATLNTVFVAQEGRIVAWAANSPEFLLEVPYVAPRPPRAKIAAARTNAEGTVSASTASATNSEPIKPRVASNPIIITRETVAQEKRTWRNMTSTSEIETGATNATNLLANSPSPITNLLTVSNQPAVATSVSNYSSVEAASRLPVSTDPKPLVSAPEESATVSRTETARTLDMANPPAVAEAEPNSGSWRPIVWAGIGAAVAFACIVAGFLMARSKRQEQPSLISQSLAHERVRAV